MIQVTAVWANNFLDIFRGIPNSGTIWNHMEPSYLHVNHVIPLIPWVPWPGWTTCCGHQAWHLETYLGARKSAGNSSEVQPWAVGTCLFINIAYIYCVAFANERIYNIYCMYVCVCYSIWMCIDVQFMGGILTLVFWDKKMVSQIISLLSNMVWPSSRGNSPMELRIQWMHLERAFNRKWPKHCTGNVEIKTLETNANWIVLHVKIINHNADQRTRWFISGFHRNKSVLNRWNIYINVHILTYKIRSTKETNIWHIILPII